IEQTVYSPARKKSELDKLQTMADYVHTSQCLRGFILEYFGEEEFPENCHKCSNCNDQLEIVDITEEAEKTFSCIIRMGGSYGVNTVAGVLKGSSTKRLRSLGFDRLSTYGLMKERTLPEIKDLINQLIAEDYLALTGGEYPVVKLRSKAVLVLKEHQKVKGKIVTTTDPEREEDPLFERLRRLRKQIAEREKVPPYIIFPDSTLREMSRRQPLNKEAMLSIKGVGMQKLVKYGDDFMTAIKNYLQDKGE
ncbi:MAG TPA: DNA helicase RecQ, partial [Firmicutes bacterium]|nr:DNA helicase RecQ [Bacillota bacterium]